MDDQPVPSTSGENNHSHTNAELLAERERAQQIVIEAEQHKATTERPGNLESQQLMDKSDDEFFHLTCHIETSLKQKIERGEYVDLEKLLPKEGGQTDNRLEWVHREGSTFLAPVSQRENKINNVKKWDQAFRIYATFYCGAKPSRAREVWQYVDVIHTSANSYSWKNVYNYDVTFRHLMEFNPNRSWGKTYNHMWNLSLRDPISHSGYVQSQDTLLTLGTSHKHKASRQRRKRKLIVGISKKEFLVVTHLIVNL